MFHGRTDMKAYLLDVVLVTVVCFIVLVILSTIESFHKYSSHPIAKSLLSQSGRWYRISLQDKDPIYALQHCDYAIAYFNAARHSASDEILEKGSGTDLHKYHNKLITHQGQILKSLPKSKGRKVQTSHASWIT